MSSTATDDLILAAPGAVAAPAQTRRARRLGLRVGAALLAAVALLSVVVPILSPYGTSDIVAPALQGPSGAHPFGTDAFGRDVMTRTFAAGRVDLFVAVVAVAVPLVVGTLIGVASGAAERRWIDSAVMRVVDAILAFPFIVLVLALVVVIGPVGKIGPLPAGLPSLFVAIFVTSWSVYARLARGQTLSLRERDFVVAARLLGYSKWRIVRRHLMPNVFATTATYAVSDVVLIIVVTASLPFLGAGVLPPDPEWGSIMYDGRAELATAPWISVAPGVMLALTGLAVSLIARALLAERR